MGFEERARRWVGSHPRVAATGAILLGVLIGAAGWESAQQLSAANAGPVGAQAAPSPGAAAPAIRVVALDDSRRGRRIRTVTISGATKTIVATVTRRIAPAVPTVSARPPQTVTQLRTIVERHAAARTVRATSTVRQTVTVTTSNGQSRTITQTTTRPAQTVTLTETRTETRTVTEPVTVTVVVTTTKGHH